MAYQVIVRGGSALSLGFITEEIGRNYRAEGGGMGPAIVGTLLITGMAALVSIPIGVLGAVYLNEYGKTAPLAKFIRTMADVMTGVPSIVMGLFIYVAYVVVIGERNGFAGALALACLMLPIVIRSTEEMLRLVPDELRQASAALGARSGAPRSAWCSRRRPRASPRVRSWRWRARPARPRRSSSPWA
ncbi:hypothetical protein GCM10029992_25760 [Glycomyces albus]